MSTSYDFANKSIIKGGRFVSSVQGVTRQKFYGRTSFLQFDTNDTSITFALSAIATLNNIWKIYIDDVLQTVPTWTAVNASTTVNLTWTTGLDGNWHKVTLMLIAGNENASYITDTGSITCDNAGTIRFPGGLDTTNYVTEKVGGSTGQTLGWGNYPPSITGRSNATKWDTPFAITTSNPGLRWDRRLKGDYVYVIASPGTYEVICVRDDQTIIGRVNMYGKSGSAWNVFVFGPIDSAAFHGYSFIVSGAMAANGTDASYSCLDEISVIGASVAAFNTAAVSFVNSDLMFMAGDSIDAGEDNLSPADHWNGYVYSNLLSLRFGFKWANASRSGETTGNLKSRFATSAATVTAADVTVGLIGLGENEATSPYTTFTTNLTQLIDSYFFTTFTNLRVLFIRQAVNVSSNRTGLNNAIASAVAAATNAAKCVILPVAASIDSPVGDGQHPSLAGFQAMASAMVATMAPYFIPDAPVIASATATGTAVNLPWSAVVGETSFTVQASTNSGFTGSPLEQTAAADDTNYTWPVNVLSASTLYYFRVKANNAQGSSAWSNTVSCTTGVKPQVSSITILADGLSIHVVFDQDLEAGGTAESLNARFWITRNGSQEETTITVAPDAVNYVDIYPDVANGPFLVSDVVTVGWLIEGAAGLSNELVNSGGENVAPFGPISVYVPPTRSSGRIFSRPLSSLFRHLST